MSSAERTDFLRFCARFPITDEANFQIPQARMYATYLNAHRQQGVEPHRIDEFILGHPGIEEEEAGSMLLRRWKDW